MRAARVLFLSGVSAGRQRSRERRARFGFRSFALVGNAPGAKDFQNELLGYVVAWWELRGEVRRGPAGVRHFRRSYWLRLEIGCYRIYAAPMRHPPYLIGNTPGLQVSSPLYYSPHSTVLSGLLCDRPGPVATEFRFGGEIHVA